MITLLLEVVYSMLLIREANTKKNYYSYRIGAEGCRKPPA